MELQSSGEVHATYWLEMLAPFARAGSPFPQHLRGTGTGRKIISAPLPDIRDSTELREVLDLAAFGVLLSRYTNNREVLIAAPAPLLGGPPLFYRMTFARGCTARAILRQVRQQIEGSLVHAEYSPADLVDRLGGVSPTSSLLQFGIATGRRPGWAPWSPPSLLVTTESQTARLEYDSARYPDNFAQQLLTHFGRFLGELASPNSNSIDGIDPLSREERSRLLVDFNRNLSARGSGRTLHGLFEEQAARRPSAIAAVFEGQSATYEELNESANRLAAFLRSSFGVSPGDRVAVSAPRSGSLIAALLGILKTGAAYVPINPKHPRDAAARMIADSGASALILDSRNAAMAGAFDGPIFFLDIELNSLPPASGPTGGKADSRGIAYAIYTSGSTGNPKAVAVEHEAAVNTILWRNQYYGVDETDVNLQIPSFAFDSSVVDIFGFLAAGATLVIPDEDQRIDPEYAGKLIEQHGVTRMIATASYYNLLQSGLAGAQSLRSVTVAGESTPLELVESHFCLLPHVRLINEYGPTENAVCSTACDLNPNSPTVPVGRPIDGVKVFVLDELGRPVPIGVPGEIFLSGAGLARGYWNRPAITAESFIPCPFLEPGTRMYRTGDWACWRTDGMLEFLGRRDRQVKIRGFRIELGEIEAKLRTHALIADAAVLAKEAPSGDRYLAAYVAARGNMGADAVATFAARVLPPYMCPSVFRLLSELPFSLNGKVDLRQLRSYDDFPDRSETEQAGSSLERALLGICRDLLKRPQLAADDDLFAAGASSLKAMEIVTAARKALPITIELLDLYSHPSVRLLAEQLSQSAVPHPGQESTTCRNTLM